MKRSEGLGARIRDSTETIIGRGIEDACIAPGSQHGLDGWGGNIGDGGSNGIASWPHTE